MNLDFVKMHGTGNDFVVIDDFSEELEFTPEQVRQLCDRHFGVGADGVILVRPSKHADCVAYMHYINDDGSLAEMCGNGVRCFAKYLVDKGFVDVDGRHFIADTLAGKRPITFETDDDGLLTLATVDMGKPRFEPAAIPTSLPSNATVSHVSVGGSDVTEEPAVIDYPLDTVFGEQRFTCVNMGNPHIVAFPDYTHHAFHEFSWNEGNAGSKLEHHEAFPERVNIECAQVMEVGASDGFAELAMRVWERGVGETLACGTGACASVVAAIVTKRIHTRKAVIHLLGGDLSIEWLLSSHVLMTGPAVTVFEGTITL